MQTLMPLSARPWNRCRKAPSPFRIMLNMEATFGSTLATWNKTSWSITKWHSVKQKSLYIWKWLWKAWKKLVGKANCLVGGKTDKDCTRASTLGINKAYQCRAVDDKDKLCTSTKSFSPVSVEFYYYRHNVYGWILRTAFPSTRPC